MKSLGLSLALGACVSIAAPGCYSTGDGTAPPPKQLYFPVGLAVSRGGNVLYVANSDFDLQWNGGTVQSYDLHLIRKHAALTISDPNNTTVPFLRPPTGADCNSATQNPPTYKTDQSGQRQPLGETCSPPVDASCYVRDSAIIGAFATDAQLGVPRPQCIDDTAATQAKRCADLVTCNPGQHCELTTGGDRLYVPVRGDASLTWANLTTDDPNVAPPEPQGDPTNHCKGLDGAIPSYPPFTIDCGTRVSGRCDALHHAGNNPNEPGNTRSITMPGEPFGMAQSPLGDVIAITHQSTTETSLFATGFAAPDGYVPPATEQKPSLQFVVEGVANGGNGIASVPHDLQALDPGVAPPNAAFLETSRSAAELDLLRFYPDAVSSLHRAFLVKEAAFTLTASAGGTDSRGIAIDPTPRIACKANVAPLGANATPAEIAQHAQAIQSCARLPARVFFANRTPASMLVGEIGEASAAGDTTYDPDRLVVFGNVPLSNGPSKLYLAPIVDAAGNYALRVFIVCFDASIIYVYDPEAGAVENVIHVAPGPFAMAFDPFDLDEVARHAPVPVDPREPGNGLKKYRFAYVASFTQSYVQMLDLDNSITNGPVSTFEQVVFTFGQPTLPLGSQ